jgi:hypothetical protein
MKRRKKADLLKPPRFRDEGGIKVFTGKLPPSFDFEIFNEEERMRRDMQIWFCISPEEVDLLFPGTQPFVPHAEISNIPARNAANA